MGKTSILFALALSAAPLAASASPACVNTRLGYEARPVGTREVMVRNSLGEHRTELMLTTTCFAMNRDDAVRVQALSNCVQTGDEVSVSALGGGGQKCRVTGVVPYAHGQAWIAHD